MLAAVIGFLDFYYTTTVITNFVLWSRRRVDACICNFAADTQLAPAPPRIGFFW
jgi:hypothetical protein